MKGFRENAPNFKKVDYSEDAIHKMWEYTCFLKSEILDGRLLNA